MQSVPILEPETSNTDNTFFAAKTSLSSSLFLSRLFVAVAFLAQIVIAWRFQHLTWDDSAITLGFSRTFALTGRIEPTPGSGIVEGYSTTMWMLLMALAAKISAAPAFLLATAKLSTLLLNLANIWLIRRWLLTWTNEISANLVAGFVGCTLMFYETINGMETPLLLFLVLLMLLLLPAKGMLARVGYLLVGSAFLLTRWESVWLLVPFVIVDRPARRRISSALTWFTVFLVSNLIRWRYFNSLLPNTIIAKRGFPYSAATPTLAIQRHLSEPFQILLACKLFLILLAGLLLYNRFILHRQSALTNRLRRAFRESWQLRFVALFSIFSLILSTAIGANWGPPQRSFYCGWPFLLALLFIPLVADLRSRLTPWIVIVICLFASLRMSVRIHDLASKQAPIYMPDATIGKMATLSTAITHLQSVSHHPNLVFAGPDMGAILLYSNGVRVVDLGLLCDAVLARTRYTDIDHYVLEERHPDLIEVHQYWTVLTGLEHSSLFLSRYRPIYVDHKRFFATQQLIAAIDPSYLIEKTYDSNGHSSESDPLEKGYLPVDYRINEDFNHYLVLK
jgi:hypothetical protein